MAAGRVEVEYHTMIALKSVTFEPRVPLHLDLLSHESVECELTESVDDENLLNSHGFCEFTYARFLSPKSNAVACHLSGGSSFVIQMDCEGGCPKPEPTPLKPYCKQSKLLRPVDIGKKSRTAVFVKRRILILGTSYSFNDGSPGFALYAPNSHCAWILPRNRYGSTNFLFSRLDLGEGDSIKAYAASDKKEKELIKEYKQGSVPESVSTTEEFLILEFWSDDKDEGLGFEGFYYFTEEQLATVAIAENLDEGTP